MVKNPNGLNCHVEAAAIAPAQLIKSHSLIFFFNFKNSSLGANNKTSLIHSLTQN